MKLNHAGMRARSFDQLLAAAACLVVLGLAGCDQKSPTEPATPRVIEVMAVTIGGDPDNSYQIFVGAETARTIAPFGTTRFSVERGIYDVEIRDIADNCLLVGPAVRQADLRSEETIRIVFTIDCAATGVEIRTHTQGSDMPDAFTLSVAGLPSIEIGLNNSVVITRLRPGQLQVEIRSKADNCGANGASAAIVEIKNRTVTPVDFTINCVAISRPETIAYSTDTTGSTQQFIEMVRTDGTGRQRLLGGAEPAWSADGKRFAYSSVFCDDWYYWYYYVCGGGIAVMDPELGAYGNIPNGEFGHNPSWSPVADVIAYDRQNGSRTELYLLTLEGQRVKLTIPGVQSAGDPDWSPDGTRLVFTCTVSAPFTDICIAKTDGSGLVRLTTENRSAFSPSWSRSGSQILFSRVDSSGEDEIALISSSGGAIASLGKGSRPSWSRDGAKVLFNRQDGLFTMNADGSDVTRITSGRHFGAAWRKAK